MGYPDTFRIPVSNTQAYKLFSQASVVPLVEYAAKLMVSQLNLGEKAQTV
jgi:DNA (cytosine-5)-methyltransferase 1